jgi:hypothetical protein
MISRRLASILVLILAAGGCGGSSSSSTSMPPGSTGTARVRYADGAPELEAPISGEPSEICAGSSVSCYLQVDGQTVSTQFYYRLMTQFLYVSPGTQSLTVLDTAGYRVGPLKSAALAAGKAYTLIVVGTYPNYRVLTFEEPPSSKGNVQLSLYEASPNTPKAGFGSFTASSHNDFKQLGTATLGDVVTVSLGAQVSNFGGFVGQGRKKYGKATPRGVNSFDKKNELPFHNATRLSLFFYDQARSGQGGRVLGSLDR